MKYKGIELKEFTSDKPVVFDPPKKMLVWSDRTLNPGTERVLAYLPTRYFPVVLKADSLTHCAEIPEETKPRRATNVELMKWLTTGNGLGRNIMGNLIWTSYDIDNECADDACDEHIRIRKWDDDEWHEPTEDYMGLEDLA